MRDHEYNEIIVSDVFAEKRKSILLLPGFFPDGYIRTMCLIHGRPEGLFGAWPDGDSILFVYQAAEKVSLWMCDISGRYFVKILDDFTFWLGKERSETVKMTSDGSCLYFHSQKDDVMQLYEFSLEDLWEKEFSEKEHLFILDEAPQAVDNKSLENRFSISSNLLNLRAFGDSYANFGEVYLQNGFYPQAMEFFDRTIEFFDRINCLHRKAKNLMIKASAQSRLGNYPGALESLEKAQKAIDSYRGECDLNDPPSTVPSIRADILKTKADVLIELGQYQPANDILTQAEDLLLPFKKECDIQFAQILSDRGGCFHHLGMEERSLENYLKAYDILTGSLKRPMVDRSISREMQEVTSNIGEFYMHSRKYDEAERFLKEALEEALSRGDAYGVDLNRLRLAQLYLARFHTEKSNGKVAERRIAEEGSKEEKRIDQFGEKAEDGSKKAEEGSKEEEARSAPVQPSYLAQARGSIASLIPPEKSVGEIFIPAEYAWISFTLAGGIAEASDDLDRAQDYYLKALDEIEKTRSLLRSDVFKIGYFEDKKIAYENLIDLLFKKERSAANAAMTFKVAEASKGRALLDMLLSKGTGEDLKASERIDTLAGSFRQVESAYDRFFLRKLISATYEGRETSGEQTPQEDVSRETSDDLALAHESFEEEMEEYIASRNFAVDVLEEPVGVPELQRSLIDDETAFVEYFLGEDDGYLWCITRKDVFWRKLPCHSHQLKEWVDSYLESLSHTGGEVDVQAGFRLYESLLKPVMGTIRAKKKIIVAPDDYLFLLSFDSLVCEDPAKSGTIVYLAEKDLRISYVPSGTVMTVLSKAVAPGKKSKVLLLGNPDYRLPENFFSMDHPCLKYYPGLKNSATEMRYIERELGQSSRYAAPVLLQGSEASAERLNRMNEAGKLKDFEILHFCAHGCFDEDNPADMAIALSTPASPRPGRGADLLLKPEDILRWKLSADLTVLSLCSSGRGMLKKTEGIIGLSRSFLLAGSQSLLITLWDVDDRSAALFMRRFYRELARQRTRSEAMKSAIRHLIKEGYRHPHHWAPFLLIGPD